MFSSCSSSSHPILLTAGGGELWVDFIALSSNSSARGFQLSLVSVPDDLRHIIDAVKDPEPGDQLDRIRDHLWGNSHQEQQLVSHLLRLLSPSLREQTLKSRKPGNSPLIEVVEENQ